jgi:hypothetical protein
MTARQRPIFFALAGLMAAWLLAMAGYGLAGHWKMTADKLKAWLAQTDLNQLSGAARAKALRDLADKINALSPEERRHARVGQLWAKWFEEMTEDEKSAFLDATLPTGFKQMLTSFEQMPEEKRKRTIDNAIKNLKAARESPPDANQQTNAATTNGPVVSESLQKQVAMIGLKSVYSDSSAETKAELAPLLEEIQRNMELGRYSRGGN